MSRNTKSVSRRMRIRNQKKQGSGSKQRIGGGFNLGFKGVPMVYLQGQTRKRFKGWQRENRRYTRYKNVS